MVVRTFGAQRTLALYAFINAVLMGLMVLRLGWISVGALFLSFFFMSIMFPTIFSLGIHGLGEQTKKASSFIVMAIAGGGIFPFLNGLDLRPGQHGGRVRGADGLLPGGALVRALLGASGATQPPGRPQP